MTELTTLSRRRTRRFWGWGYDDAALSEGERTQLDRLLTPLGTRFVDAPAPQLAVASGRVSTAWASAAAASAGAEPGPARRKGRRACAACTPAGRRNAPNAQNRNTTPTSGPLKLRSCTCADDLKS